MTVRKADTQPDSLVEVVRERLTTGQRLRRNLPGWGRLAIDRPLPFLCVYRRPTRRPDAGAYKLVTSEPSYLTASGERRQHGGVEQLASAVVETQGEAFGGFLIVEVWTGKQDSESESMATEQPPSFRIYEPRDDGHETLTDHFEEALRRISIDGRRAWVEVVSSSRRWPSGTPPIVSMETAEQARCFYYGLEVAPFFRDPSSGEPYPPLLNKLRRRLSVALKRFFYEFAEKRTTADPAHFHVLGRRAVIKAVWEADAILADASESYEFLLQLTPVNGEQAWNRFERGRFERSPSFHYRPLQVDPVVLKRGLYRAPVERIEDPALAIVFREKIDELDRQITMLQDRNTKRFLPESVQLYGGVEDDLQALALDLLEKIPPRSREGRAPGTVNAEAFAQRAREEIEFLRAQGQEVATEVEVRPDVTGLLVSKGRLLVSAYSKIPVSRVEALVQHEVGTHVLTYHNGKVQKLRLLSNGLAGYDSLQEGLAVLSEYLVGGLSRPRLRLLAARVVAAHCLLDGATFVDTFRRLQATHGFAGRIAFTVTARTFRSGGLTKDVVYLRGLRQILGYLGRGGELTPLFAGKIAAQHIPIIRELTWRGVLVDPPLMPRYMNQPEAMARLERLKGESDVADLLEG
jgi:uncharacterized protein (TIGR02421 family)